MRRFLLATLAFLVTGVDKPDCCRIELALARGCTGGSCSACKNCRYCAHCKGGGTCSVCDRTTSSNRPTELVKPLIPTAGAELPTLRRIEGPTAFDRYTREPGFLPKEGVWMVIRGDDALMMTDYAAHRAIPSYVYRKSQTVPAADAAAVLVGDGLAVRLSDGTRVRVKAIDSPTLRIEIERTGVQGIVILGMSNDAPRSIREAQEARDSAEAEARAAAEQGARDRAAREQAYAEKMARIADTYMTGADRNVKGGRYDAAAPIYRRIVKEFPGTEQAQTAQEKLDALPVKRK